MLNRLENTITAVLIALLVFVVRPAFAQAPQPPVAFKPGAPERYIVVPGDTLWGIAERFTDSPWRWPELWNLNKEQIKDPHRIYPGDVIIVNRKEGRLETTADTVKLSPRVRAEPAARTAIPSIPPSAIEPFLSRPLIVERDGLDKAPTIIGTQDDRVVITTGDAAYVSGMGASREDTWFVYRRGSALVDPDGKHTLGYEAVYLGTAQLVRAGDPATVRLTHSAQEIQRGDKLVAAGKPVPVEYAPRAPAAFKDGRIISIYGSIGEVGETGAGSVVALNRGRSDGLEVGHVLALFRPVSTSRGGSKVAIALPDERYGLAFVFRVFDRVSYALVMQVARPVQPLDVVRAP